MSTDQGSDEAKYRRIAQAVTKDVNEVLVLSIVCVFHIGHLIAKGTLMITDMQLAKMGKPFKYFGTMAKLVNV